MVMKQDKNTNKFYRVAFEDIDLENSNYADLKNIEGQLLKSLRMIGEYIEDYKQDPAHDDEITAYSESEYLKRVEREEREAWESSDI